jgi:hypothetical protein
VLGHPAKLDMFQWVRENPRGAASKRGAHLRLVAVITLGLVRALARPDLTKERRNASHGEIGWRWTMLVMKMVIVVMIIVMGLVMIMRRRWRISSCSSTGGGGGGGGAAFGTGWRRTLCCCCCIEFGCRSSVVLKF